MRNLLPAGSKKGPEPPRLALSIGSGQAIRSGMMENESTLGRVKIPTDPKESEGRSISVQVLEFKTSLLEAVEELHIRRDAETRYEQQICKLVLEKQELEWQKDSLQSQISKMSNENSESVAAVKKQGKTQLAAELKDKEIASLKEELKQLQLLRYSLEKKLSELEQKLQLQTQTKDSHLNQLGEVERRFATISRQCTMLKQAHEKLEQNVEEAIRINKKLISINENQESTIKALKEETEMNKKLQIESAKERADKQEVLKSLRHSLSLLQTQMEALCQTEKELSTLREDYKVLKTEQDLNQERTKEKDEILARLKDEYQNSKMAWEKEILECHLSAKAEQDELMATKEAYSQLQEGNKKLTYLALHKTDDGLTSKADLKGDSPGIAINLAKMSSLQKDSEESLISPYENGEPMCHTDKDIPEATKYDSSLEENANPMEVDGEISLLSLPTKSDNMSNPEDHRKTYSDASLKTNLVSELCDKTNNGVRECESICISLDKGCPSNSTHSDTDGHLVEISESETRNLSTIGLDMLTKWNMKPPHASSKSGLYELDSPFCAPLFRKDTFAKQGMYSPIKTPERLDVPSKRPHLKSDGHGEWNAVKQSFSEMLLQKENHLNSYNSTPSTKDANSSSVVSGLPQDYTPSVSPPKPQSLQKPARPVTPNSEARDDWKQSDIMAQIAKIEQFMSSEGLLPPKRSKTE
ncbi:hypothetical protein DNTS_020565 [Danionella cerebrum]|uniref:Coiled-coil domain-containing protein 73 n=1 Tax=Danionella cerebrum TaxID=2873325 RepID=A0A553R8G3_9TELE|nr:hypothetical protein DNTS_020565 [Danionella translucida]